ncbi:MAG: rod shape-determining protein RodA [Mucinivorans sp.]
MIEDRKIGLTSSGIDYWTVLIYVVLVLMGWVSIYSAVYNDDGRSALDLTQLYGTQLIWISVSFVLALSILLIDSKYYHLLAYQLYWFMIVVMVGVTFFGMEVNGARAWIPIGSFRVQPVEFMKIVTALALAKLMSGYNFNIRDRHALFNVGVIIFLPVLLILAQNDTGSALVFAAFFIILYREGFGRTLYILFGAFVFLAIISFFVEPIGMLLVVLAISLGIEIVLSGAVRQVIQYIFLLLLFYIVVEVVRSIFGLGSDPYSSLLWSVGLSVPLIVYYSHRSRLPGTMASLGFFIAAVLFTFFIDYAFNNILQSHQQVRILDLMGLQDDPKGAGYNALQSKIAIGSGGVWGKGFLQGTQTRFSFVPEQSTDFIFCTVGEEWGFVGSMTVIALFILLILRLMRMGERQSEPFARIYCYSVAAIIFMHFFINIAMAIGIFPVVGIPLPFFSYGGSSLVAFTILVFVAIRLDSTQIEGASRKLF